MVKFNHNTDKHVQSGYYIDLKTTNPVAYPLPSLALLEMLWHLNRVATMYAGTGPKEDLGDEENSDEDVTYACRWVDNKSALDWSEAKSVPI